MSKPKIAIIISSTRPARFGHLPAEWIKKQADAHGQLDTEIVDLRDFKLPFFDEDASNAWMPSKGEQAQRWQKKVGSYDGYIFVVAEYNRSITGELKNALDQAYVEWNRKPFGAIAYGSVGGARALEHLRNIGTELQMVSTRSAVHIGGGEFYKVHLGMGGSGKIEDIEAAIGKQSSQMLDELTWWAGATMAAKAKG